MATTPTSQTSCPCGSELALAQCCQPVIQGKQKPATAEQLLRARYTAFTQGAVDYILSTHHSRTRHEVKREEIEDWSKNSRWLGLKIVQSEAGKESDTQGTIVFCASYHAEDKDNEHWEQSYFEKEDGEWRFLDAKGIQTGPIRREGPKIGRNDPCHCGSGQKYKKCHGK
jgi:SEC-C motif-containing protein